MDKEKLAQERTEWAEERTEWADQRTFLAQQRTFAGWVRTGLTAMAVGFGTIEFIGKDQPPWLISGIGLIFILLGAFIPLLALVSYRNVQMHMKSSSRPKSSISSRWVVLITVALVLAGLGGLVLVFI